MDEYSYLASPYTHPDPIVREYRYLRTLEATQILLANRVWVFSPIVHCHHMAQVMGMPHEAAFWLEYDTAMIKRSRGIFVLMLEGWSESVGVKGEIQLAIQLGLPITYLHTTGEIRAVIENQRPLHRSEQAARKD